MCSKTDCRFLNRHALKVSRVVLRPAGRQLDQAVIAIGLGCHVAARAAEQGGACIWIAAHKGGGSGVHNTQAAQQRFCRVIRTGGITAVQNEWRYSRHACYSFSRQPRYGLHNL